MNLEALKNIALLAFDAVNPERNATRRIDVILEQISILNHQEVHDREIARQLVNIHRSPAQRAEAILARAKALLPVKPVETQEDYDRMEAYLQGEHDGYRVALGQEIAVQTYSKALVLTYAEGFRAGIAEAEKYAQRLAFTTRHLTVDEIDRLLHRYDLSPIARKAIEAQIASEQEDAWERYSEQMAEYGRARQPESAWDRYYKAKPLYGPVPPPVEPIDDHDDIPF